MVALSCPDELLEVTARLEASGARQSCVWCFCPAGFLEHTTELAGGSTGAAARVGGRRLDFFGLTEETRDGCQRNQPNQIVVLCLPKHYGIYNFTRSPSSAKTLRLRLDVCIDRLGIVLGWMFNT
jgi:hypothetical protein